MRVREVMTKKVEFTRPDATLQEAAEMMRSLDVGSLPVCDGNRVVGMITDRDITVRGTARATTATNLHVRDAMTPDVIACREDQLITEAGQLMQENQIRRVMVLNHDQELVGIVSLGDIAVETRDEELTGNALEGISEPGQPNR